jgi:Cadherin-like domain/SdrD B-like domain/Bacterial cadherin-like domain/RTX calcium-binding nonapeptide repeat (4 copies)
MAVNVTRTSSLFTDSDGDGVADPGETLLVHILIQNATAADITNLKVYDTQNGLTIDTSTVMITPIAFDDFSPGAPLTIVGNTPYIVTASALLGNDIDPDGLEASLSISSLANQNHVTVTNLGGGNYQIVPETGYQGVASFEYFITDAQGLNSVSSGKVNILISGQVWYVDNGYAGANGTSDGSYLKPFTSLGQLNDDGTGAGGTVGPNDGIKGDDDVDGAGDTIFVYNHGTTYTGGITLEAGQKLHGDGHEMTVNGFAIGTPGQTANSTVNYSTYGVTLATDNTISGLNLNGTANTGVGIQDGNGSVTTAAGTLNVDTVTLSGAGQAVDIDQGGNLNVALTSLSTTGTAAGPAVQLAGTAASGTALISGTFTASGGGIAGEAGHGFQIGGQGPSSGGTIAVTYGGTIGSSSAGSAVNIADRIANAGDINFTGNISQTSTVSNTSAGIALSSIADGNINFTGTKTINVTGGAQNAIQIGSVSGDSAINFSGGAIDIDFAAGTTGHALAVTSQSGTSSINVSTATDIDMVGSASGRGINIGSSTAGSVNFTGGSLTISTRDGAAVFDSNSAGSTHSLNISGSGNTASTTNGGQLVEISNAATTGITFNTLTTGASVAGTAVHVNNLDGGSFNTTTLTVTGTAGVGADGIRIEGGSTATFNLGTVGVSNTSEDGIELNGANGAVTIDSISVQNTLGQGVEIVGATSAVTITAGGIGNTNDPAAEAVLITGGSGNVTVGATITKTTAGNVVEVTGHTSGAVSFSNTISATGAVDNGILLTNNTGGTIAFGGNVTLTTGGNDALTFTNTAGTGAAVSLTGGNLAITTTGAGDGIFATSTNVGAGSLTITGANNTISTVNGAALTVDDVRIGSTGIALKSVNVTDASGYGIFLDNTGTTAGTHGGLTITGDATASKTAGGTISAADNAGISISNARDIVLDQMTIQNGLDDGVAVSNVTNFSLTQSNIVNNGNALNEHGVDASNVTGTVRFTDVTLTNNEHEQVHYNNNAVGATSADVEFNNVDMTSTGLAAAPNGSHGINLTADGASSIDVRVVNGSSFDNMFSNSFQAQNEGTGTLEITIANSTFTNVGASAINIAQNDSGTVRFNIHDNGTAANPTFLKPTTVAEGGGVSHSININQAGGTPAGAILEGKISNNYIGNASSTTSANAGGDGIRVLSVGSGTTNVQIDNNTIRGVGSNGINVQMSEDTNPAHTMNVTIFNNNVTVSDVNSFDGIRVSAGAQSTDVGTLRLDMHDNTASSATGNDFTVRQRFQTTVELLNLGSNNASDATVQNYLDVTRNNNPTGAGTDWFITNNLAGAPAGGGFDNTASVTAPTLPSPLLLINPEFAVPKDSPIQATPPTVDSGGAQGGTPGTGSGQTVSPTDPSGGNMPIVGAPTPSQGGPAAPTPTVVDDGKVSQAELDLLVSAAIDRWAAAGATPEQIATMRAVKVSLTDMMGVQIGGAAPGTINIDADGGGHGWFVDATPGDDSEFAGSGTRLKATEAGGASGQVDLLTVLMHELGHQIGLGDSYLTSEVHGLMYGYVDIGERRLPAAGEAAEGDGHAPAHEAYLLSPVADVGTLPAGKSVDIQFKAAIDSYFNQIISTLINTANVKGDGGLNQDSNSNVTTLDTLTLGNLVFLDVNKDGDYDAGTDTGIVGVVVDLYADTNGNNAWDGGDTFLATTTTLAGGLYSFTGLSAGNYVVVVKSTNFDSGGQLEGLLVTPGTAADPDATNADGDNNGAAAAGGAVAAAPISLAYNQEPAAGPGNDTNNTVDFGFVQNDPPVANDDPGLIATEDEDSQYSTELTGNDTDADAGDTITIVSAGNATNGSVSVTAGVVTFTPTANFNGVATFEYTIDDGHGNTDTAVATVTVGAANDPVTIGAPGTASLNEDSVDFAVTGISIADVDAALAPAGVYEVVLQATHGTLKLTTVTGLTFTAGDGTGNATMTFHGTLADINTALATAKYTPAANYNGSAQIDIDVTDDAGVTVATGSGAATADSDSIALTVNSVNDEPAGTNDDATVIEAEPYEFLPADFSAGFSDPIDNNSFAGVKITELPLTGTLKLNGVAIAAGDTITLAQLTAGDFTYESPAGSAGTSPTFKFAVQDNGGNTNGGVEYDQSPNTFTLNIVPADIAPVLDLDASGAGTGFASAYTEGAAAAAISDTDVSITDADVGDKVEGATITITNAVAGDVLTVVGALPGTITIDPSSTATNLVLTGTGTQAQYEAAIEQITFSSSSDNPTANGTNTSRTINVTVTDGDLPSNVAVSTVTVTDVNDAPAGTSAIIAATEDTFRLLEEGDFGTVDADGSFATVTISAATGGAIYVDADGSAGAGGFVLETLPKTYSKQDLIDGKVAFKANQDLNGTGVGTITFAVTDDDGATDASPNVLTVDVAAVNDSPDIDGVGQPVDGVEQTAVAILAGKGVSDVDLDARNGGNGDYAGASFSIARNLAANPEDAFSLVPGPGFTLDGNNLKAGGQIFATITTNSGGQLVIAFTSLETVATSALVDSVIASVNYTNTSDNPPSSVSLAYSFNDGAPGGGQGAGASATDDQIVSVLIAAVNDAPVNSLGGTIGTGEDAVDAWLSGMSVSDPDADPATAPIYVTFQVAHGTIEIRDDVPGGIVSADIVAQSADTITVLQTQDKINTTLAATNGLTYSPNLNFNGDDTLTVTTNDQGLNGSDPGLTGNGTSEEDVDTRTISVSPQPDAPIAQPDAISTPENVIKTGSLFANNGSGPDTDADGDTITVSEVNGSPADVGMPIMLASGAILTVNANGTYSYNPNGKFNRLTDSTSGAVNTSTVGDTFSYTVTGGNTVSVTVTVNGVAGPGDWLMGDGTGNTITGTPQVDTFILSQGGNDTVSGLASDDIFYFGGALTADDNVTGGSGVDTIVLQGDYSGGLTLDGSVTGVERISMLAGTNTAFGNSGALLYDYVLTISDANFTGGLQVRINGAALLAGEDFTFDGSAETDAKFVVYGGKGTDDLTGGDGNDIFFFAEGGRFAAGDTVDGGDGYDGLFLRGNYTIDFTQAGYAGALANLENLTVSGAGDERYARGGGTEFDYSITWDGDLLGGGQTMTINGSSLGSDESLAFNGSDETDGNFKLFGGAGNDVLTGGAGTDLIFGGLRGDTLTGGAGNDIFRYDSVAESNSTERDGIQDFNAGDLIDLSRIDANTLLGGNQAFNFIGSAAFSNTAGELRFENISLGGPIWLVQGDVDGNGVSDFEVVLVINPVDPITSSDFIL